MSKFDDRDAVRLFVLVIGSMASVVTAPVLIARHGLFATVGVGVLVMALVSGALWLLLTRQGRH